MDHEVSSKKDLINTFSAIEKEAYLSRLFYKYNLGPKILEVFYCSSKQKSFFIMEKKI